MEPIARFVKIPAINGPKGNRILILACVLMIAVLAGCSRKSPKMIFQEMPAGIVISADDSIIEVGGAATTISAILFDQNGEPLSDGYGVQFTITAAPSLNGPESPSFEYASSEDSVLLQVDKITDLNGTASVRLYSGTGPGPVHIRAVSLDNTSIFAEEHLVTIAIRGPATITLGVEDSTIEVGFESTVVFATVYDEFANNIGWGYGVRLEITEAPGNYGVDRPSFEYPPSDDSISHIYEGISDVDGQVEAELFSGCNWGWVAIRGTVIENENISVEELLVMIEPGPPAFIEIAFGGPVDSVGDSLYATLAAGIWDQYANPAGFGDTVYVEIEPDSIVSYQNIVIPEIPPYPDTAQGWGSTSLGYVCYHSLDTIRVIASTGLIADTVDSFALPIYNGEIYLSADPGTIWIEPPDTVGYSDITVLLLDGIGCEISSGIIYFAALVCGELSAQSTDTTDNDGYAHTQFMIHIDDIPGPPPDPPQCTCIVRAILFGYPDVESEVEIICSRPL